MAIAEPQTSSPAAPAADPAKVDAFRRWGYLAADLDPLERLRPESHPALGDLTDPAVQGLRRIYSGPLGVELPDRCTHPPRHNPKDAISSSP